MHPFTWWHFRCVSPDPRVSRWDLLVSSNDFWIWLDAPPASDHRGLSSLPLQMETGPGGVGRLCAETKWGEGLGCQNDTAYFPPGICGASSCNRDTGTAGERDVMAMRSEQATRAGKAVSHVRVHFIMLHSRWCDARGTQGEKRDPWGPRAISLTDPLFRA